MRNTTKKIDQKSFRSRKTDYTKITFSECQSDYVEFKRLKYRHVAAAGIRFCNLLCEKNNSPSYINRTTEARNNTKKKKEFA
jgi:hypothetical protein